jgi:MFS family permease
MSSLDSAGPQPASASLPVEPVTLFAIRDFRFLFLLRILSTGASNALAVAIGWQIYALTGSALNLGLIGLFQFVAFAASSLAGGQAADLYDRRVIMRLSFGAQILVAAALVPVTLYALHPVAWIYLLMAVYSAARAFEPPSADSLVAAIMPPALLSRAVASYKAGQRTAAITTPVLAGFLYALGPEAVYALVAAALFLAGVASMLVQKPPRPPQVKKVSWATILAGVDYIRHREVLLAAVSLDLVAVLFGGATALFPIFARDFLDLGPWGLGILRSAPSVGAILAGIFIARSPIRGSAGKVMLYGIVVYGLSYVVFGLSHSLILSCAALMISGAGDMLSMVVRHTILQAHTPDEVRGRVTAANSLFTASSGQLGEFESGVTAAWFGPVGSVVFGAVATLAVVGLWAWKFPILRRIDRLDQPLPK